VLPKAKTLRSEQKQASRENILDAATKLLAEHGYAALRVAAVAQAAGVSLGGHLHHFPSKDSLIVAVLERLSTRAMLQAMEEAASASRDVDPLRTIAKSASRFYAAPEFLIYLDIFLSVRRHTMVGDTAIRLLRSSRAQTEGLWLPLLSSRGYADADALLIVRTLWGVSRGLAISASTEQRQAENQATIDFVIEALRRSGFGGCV
jgi:AcrR family transcriptional regulator